jgi:hypothetical protein
VQGNWLNLPHCVEMQNHQNLGNNTMTTLNPSTLTEPLKKPSLACWLMFFTLRALLRQ